MNPIIYSLSIFGVWYVTGGSYISLATRRFLFRIPILRPFILLIECPACLGFWLGTAMVCLHMQGYGVAVADTTVVPFASDSGFTSDVQGVPLFLTPFFSASVSYILGRFLGVIPAAYTRDN